jgi:anaerobic ribonucleoside-triphosphate reductase
LKLQDELQGEYTGGTLLRIFLGEQVKDTVVIRNLVRKIAAHHRLPYFTLTPTISRVQIPPTLRWKRRIAEPWVCACSVR